MADTTQAPRETADDAPPGEADSAPAPDTAAAAPSVDVPPETPQPYNSPSTVRALLRNFVLRDLFSIRNHSRDFSGSRAEHMTVRVRLMALIMALTTPTWIAVDYLTVPGDAGTALVVTRVAVTFAFLGLGMWGAGAHSLTLARAKLALLLLIGTAFYLSSRLILGDLIDGGGLIAGYSFIPFLFLAMLTLFPLTMLEGALLCLIAVGALAGAESIDGTLLAPDSLSNLWLMGLISAFAIGAQLSQLQMLLQLHRQATRDALTGLFNRRVLMERLDQEISRTARYGGDLSVLLLDLDRFKRINDTYGHLTGDAVLKVLASNLDDMLRTADICGRYGGEEFLLVLPETGRDGARELAERIREQAEKTVARGPGGRDVAFTISIGVAGLTAGDDADILFKKADGCLYQAKETGRNRVVVAD